jgi:MarR family
LSTTLVKGGAQRGSSKKEDTLDTVIMLKRPADYLPEQAARFEIHFEKYRGPAGDEVSAIEAVLAKDADGRSCSWRTVDEGTFDRVVVALANDGLKPGEIAAELEIHKSNVSRHMKRARSLGLVVGGAS